jgi:hypothetical protein
MTDNDMTDAFLKKHAPNLDTHQLAPDMGSFGVAGADERCARAHLNMRCNHHSGSKRTEQALGSVVASRFRWRSFVPALAKFLCTHHLDES